MLKFAILDHQCKLLRSCKLFILWFVLLTNFVGLDSNLKEQRIDTLIVRNFVQRLILDAQKAFLKIRLRIGNKMAIFGSYTSVCTTLVNRQLKHWKNANPLFKLKCKKHISEYMLAKIHHPIDVKGFTSNIVQVDTVKRRCVRHSQLFLYGALVSSASCYALVEMYFSFNDILFVKEQFKDT